MPTAATTETKSQPPPAEKIKVKVDGKEVEVPKTMPDPVSGKPLLLTQRDVRELQLASAAISAGPRRRPDQGPPQGQGAAPLVDFPGIARERASNPAP